MDMLPSDQKNTTQLPQSPDPQQNVTMPAYPGGAEAPLISPESQPKTESADEELFSLEDLKAPETLISKPYIPNEIEEEAPPALADIVANSAPQEVIVDKTEKITELHHIEGTVDKLTKEADEEEEHFIEEVEKHHGHI